MWWRLGKAITRLRLHGRTVLRSCNRCVASTCQQAQRKVKTQGLLVTRHFAWPAAARARHPAWPGMGHINEFVSKLEWWKGLRTTTCQCNLQHAAAGAGMDSNWSNR